MHTSLEKGIRLSILTVFTLFCLVELALATEPDIAPQEIVIDSVEETVITPEVPVEQVSEQPEATGSYVEPTVTRSSGKGYHSEPVKEAQEDSFYNNYIKGHLRIGTRTVYRTLTDSDSGHRGGWYGSGTYLGTIYALDEDQQYAPLYPFITYFINKYIGVELAYDQIKAKTVAMALYSGQSASDLENGYEKTDGTAKFTGPTLSIILQYPNETGFTPYVGVGIGFYSATFDSTEDWEYAHDGKYHDIMDVDNTTGLVLTLGTDWNFTENWSLGVSLQYVNATMDANFSRYYNVEGGTKVQADQPGEFPMDNIAFRIGVAYTF